MSDIKDKVTGRVKQATGDLLGDEDTRRQGVREERKGEAKEEAIDDADVNADAMTGAQKNAVTAAE